MTTRSKPVFAFPHHDPTGKFNGIFLEQLPELKKIFSDICISATSITMRDNAAFIEKAREAGCEVFGNAEGSFPGDHFRNALRIAIEKHGSSENIFFGNIDRVLFQLVSEHKPAFVTEIAEASFDGFLVYERTAAVWDAYPRAYKEMEKHVTRIGALIFGGEIEYNLCAAMMTGEIAEYLVANSRESFYNVSGEWILLYRSIKGYLPEGKKVDWLAWEDPYWENTDAATLKAERENDKNETLNRIRGNAQFIPLFYDERFVK